MSSSSRFGLGTPLLGSLPGERPPVPAAVETDSPTAWAEFERLQAAQAVPFADTMVESREMPSFAPTEVPGTFRSSPTQARASVPARISLNDVLVEARRFNRVSPKPRQWQKLYAMLPPKVIRGRSQKAKEPISGAGWHSTSAMAKRICLRDHLEWAEATGALQQVMHYLLSLSEDEWHHMDD